VSKEKIYALINPAGSIIKADNNLDSCLSYYPWGLSTEASDNLCRAPSNEEKRRILEANGFIIKVGTFTELKE
jgi:hypothetical protein